MTTPLWELVRVFLTLGSTAFGGPAAHIAMMEAEVVRKRGWLSREAFLDLLGATNLIPGPNSTEMAIHIGYRKAGWPGLLVAGTCFILPAFLIVAGLAGLYVTYGTLPAFGGVLYGVKPMIIAVVVQALWNLGKSAFKTPFLIVLAFVAVGANLAGCHELSVLLGAGLVMGVSQWFTARRAGSRQLGIWPALWLGRTGLPLAAGVAPFGLWPLFMAFFKVGALLFGSGYVLVAFLQGELVHRLGWLTEPQLLDAVAVGQVTPGPVFTTATFIGYLLAGWPGAVVATLGIFLPAFLFVALSGPLVGRIRQSAIAGAFLDGVNVAAVALMAVVTYRLADSALIDPLTVLLAIAGILFLLLTPVNSVWLILAGAVAGLIHGGG